MSPSTRLAAETPCGCRLVNPEELAPGLRAWHVDPRDPNQIANPQSHAGLIVLSEDPLEVMKVKGSKVLHVVYDFLRPRSWARIEMRGRVRVEVFTGLFERKSDDNRLHFWIPIEGRL
jgi:hypothetical protein